MPTAKKAAAKKAESAPASEKAGPETRTVTYLAPGVAPDLTPRAASLDPKLAEIREAEIKANDVPINPTPQEPSIDPELVKARDEQIKRERERANQK